MEDPYTTKKITLRPIFKTDVMTWSAEENVAKCDSHNHPDGETPFETCGCGFYAWTLQPHIDVTGDVVGVIAGYGRTLQGSKGFRSHKARIVGFVAPDRKALKAALIESFPDIPIFDTYQDLLTKHPLSTPPDAEEE